MGSTGEAWREAFWKTLRQQQNAAALKDAALRGRLGAWTRASMGVVVSAREGKD